MCLDCVKITFDEGIFHYKSRAGSRTCGLYLTADPDKVISITIEYIDVLCQQGGLISVSFVVQDKKRVGVIACLRCFNQSEYILVNVALLRNEIKNKVNSASHEIGKVS